MLAISNKLVLMKKIKIPREKRWLCAALAVLPCWQSYAQDSSEEEAPIELSPFTVDAADDTGYRATNTLAGSRLNTQLKDVAASVSVVTTEFMDDLGTNDISETLAYVAGAETNITTEMSDDRVGYIRDRVADNPSNNRLRGLGAADVTADFFNVGFGNLDSYNVERLSVVRGPNSILSGLGSPAGILDYTIKKAYTEKNSGSLGFKFDDQGSIRTTIDLNRILVEDKLAIRVMGLHEDAKTQFDSTKDKDERITATMTYKPFSGTTIRAMYEEIKLDANRARFLAPADNISGWIAAGRPTWDAFANPGVNPPAAIKQLDGIESNALQFYTDMDSSDPEFSTMLNLNPNGQFGDEGHIRFYRSGSATEDTPFYIDPQVGDERMFPLQDVDLSSLPGSYQIADSHKQSLTIEQVITDDLQVELGFYKDGSVTDDFHAAIDQSAAIQVDVNETLPDGRENPNFLRPFLFGRGVGQFRDSESDSMRLTLAYKFDFSERSDRLSFLGEHHFSGLFSQQNSELFRYAWEPRTDAVNEIFQTTLESGSRRIGQVWYVGPAFTNDMDFPTYSGFPTKGFALERPFSLEYYDPDTKEWHYPSDEDYAPGTVNIKRLRHTNKNWSREEIEGYGGALQSFFLNRKIVTTLGWRTDEVTSFSSNAAPIDSTGLWNENLDTWDLKLDSPGVQDGSTVTKGIVYHATDWLSFHYNESENFKVSAQKVDILGRVIGPESGVGKDYGFTVNLLENKLSAKVNFYETAQTNSQAGALGFLAYWTIPGYENRLYDYLLLEGREDEYTYWDGTTGNPELKKFQNVADVNDFVAEGMEIEISYNPLKNWRIAFNAGKQETIKANSGRAIQEYMALRAPFWNQFANEVPGTTETFAENLYSTVQIPLDNALAGDGQVSLAQAKWNWNAVTNYSFADGRFKGLAVGGSVRWKDKSAIGYATKETDGGTAIDLDNPFYADSTLHVGLHASYSRKVFNDQMNWKIQLNIKNIVGDDNLMPARINPDGQVSAWRIGRDRSFELSNTLSF